MTIADRVAAMRAAGATQTQPAPAQIKARVTQAAPSSEKVFDSANNTVAKIMERSDLSDKGKLEAVVAFLTAKDDNYVQAQKAFAEFEAYFTYEQSRRTQFSEQNIQRLMDELEDGTKATIEHILSDFNVVSSGAGNIRKRLRVMENARLDGTTVEVLTSAYRLNEGLLKEIATLSAALETQQKEETSAVQTQKRLQGLSKDNATGVMSKLFRVFGSNETMADSLYYSGYSLKVIQTKMARYQHTLTEKQNQRDKRLEDGELTILRTVDATEDGFTDQILKTARDSLALIKGTRMSIETLLVSNAKSQAASGDLTMAVNGLIGIETVLCGAVRVVAKQTREQGGVPDTTVDTLKEKPEASDDAARDYERVLEAKVVSFDIVAQAVLQAEARAQHFATLVESHRELLSSLHQQALPVTARALEMGLQQGIALRDATKQAQVIFGSNPEGANDARSRQEAEALDQMREAIAALGEAQALITVRTDKAIEHGLASRRSASTESW